MQHNKSNRKLVGRKAQARQPPPIAGVVRLPTRDRDVVPSRQKNETHQGRMKRGETRIFKSPDEFMESEGCITGQVELRGKTIIFAKDGIYVL